MRTTFILLSLLTLAPTQAMWNEVPGASDGLKDAERAAIADEILGLNREVSKIFDSDLDCEEIIDRLTAARRLERFASQGRLFELGSRDEMVSMCGAIKQDRLSAREDFLEEHVEVLSRDTAYVVWRSTYTVRFKDGRTMVRPQALSTFWVRSAEGWRMVHLHESWQEPGQTTQPLIPSSRAPGAAVSPVLDVLERIRQTVRDCRIEDYATHWADGSTIFISSGNPLMPNQEYLGVWRQVCAGGGGMQIGPVEEEVTVLAEGVVLVTGSMGYAFTAPDGEVHSGTSRTTTILREIDGEWKLVHAHASELGVHGGVAE